MPAHSAGGFFVAYGRKKCFDYALIHFMKGLQKCPPKSKYFVGKDCEGHFLNFN